MRKVFVSYHHADQYAKDEFVRHFSQRLGVFTDGSLDDRVDSTQTDYVHRQIREEYITGTSATIVLCGAETWKRRYVDWEIHSTLYKRHGLLGILLPSAQMASANSYTVPGRLADNLPDYARLIHMPSQGQALAQWIETVIASALRIAPNNSRLQMINNRA